MKKSFLISLLIITALLSACQSAPTPLNNSADESKTEKASAESTVSLTVGDPSANATTATATDPNAPADNTNPDPNGTSAGTE